MFGDSPYAGAHRPTESIVLLAPWFATCRIFRFTWVHEPVPSEMWQRRMHVALVRCIMERSIGASVTSSLEAIYNPGIQRDEWKGYARSVQATKSDGTTLRRSNNYFSSHPQLLTIDAVMQG